MLIVLVFLTGNGGGASAGDMEADGNGDSDSVGPRIPAPESSTKSHLSVNSETSRSTSKVCLSLFPL